MSKAPTDWMPLDVGKYLADTMDLSAEQHGAYLLLIMHYWKNRGPIKNDKNSLKNVTKISSKITQEILQRFFILLDGLWHHKKIDDELNNAIKNKEKKKNQTEAARHALHGKTDSVTEPVTGLRAETPLPLTNTEGIKTPSSPLPPSEGVGKPLGVLKNGNGGTPFDITHKLSDTGRAAAREEAPGWDLYFLAGIYNEGIRSGKREPPNNPDRAFAAWAGKYTKGNPP